MKKSKLLIGVVALSVALMGTGYAWWTESVTTTGTVNTAKMDAMVTAAELLKVDANNNDKYLDFVQQPTIDPANGNESFTFKIAKMYPNSTAQLDVTVKNTGNIGIKVDDVVIDSSTNDLINHLQFGTALDNLGTLADLKTKIKGAIGDKEIGAGESRTFSVYINMPNNSTDTTGAAFEERVIDQVQQFHFAVNFAQFNKN